MICLLSEKDHTSFLTVEKEWGYFSDKKDGRIHRMDICESCYEKMVKKFERSKIYARYAGHCSPEGKFYKTKLHFAPQNKE